VATTYKDVLNRVLRALGDDEIDAGTSTISSTYHKLLGLFVNQVLEECEDAHNWRALRSTQSITITASTNTATLASTVSERCRVYREQDEIAGTLRPLCFDVTDSTNPIQLWEMDLAELLRRTAMDTTESTYTQYFALDQTAEGGVAIYVWPTPSTQRTIDLTIINPQAYLDDDELATNIKIPTRPVILGATWWALIERGEELGVNALFSEARFRAALQDAISRDSAEQGGYQMVPV